MEYERSSARWIKLWRFQDFFEAEEFRRRREEFYRTIGLDKERGFTRALPEISKGEIDMFNEIIQNPDLLYHVMRIFNVP
jgi:hypothetical protein